VPHLPPQGTPGRRPSSRGRWGETLGDGAGCGGAHPVVPPSSRNVSGLGGGVWAKQDAYRCTPIRRIARRTPGRPGPHLAVGPATTPRAAPRRPRLFGPAVTLGDLQAFAAGLEAAGLAPASRRLTLAAVKSLLAFGQRVGYLRFDVGAAVKLPPVKDALAERILDREAVLRLIDREPDARNRAVRRLLYAGGLRVSEACALRWRDLQPRDDVGQVTLYGKGGKTRVVLLSPATWRVLLALPGAAAAVGGEDAAAPGTPPLF
jgi:integrase